MRYEPICSTLFIDNRNAFIAHLPEGALAVFNSCDVYPVSADTSLPFQQHTDMFYLSGIDQEETILLLFPAAIEPKHKEILFIKKTDKSTLVWEGRKLTEQMATHISGIQIVYWIDSFDTVFKNLMSEAKTVYLNQNQHNRYQSEVETREDRYIKKVCEQYPLHQKERSAPILKTLRSIKKDAEIKLIKTACQITQKGFSEVLKMLKPNVWEFELEAIFSHEFIRNRAMFSYSPIIASGVNSNILHYIDNSKCCLANELVLMDVGARYANYCSDVTRTYPVSGKFTERQKEVYRAVLAIKTAAQNLLTSGITWEEYKKETSKIMGHQLVKLKLIQDPNCSEAIKIYFPHGLSHHLGLDTHDYGPYEGLIQAGMVLTIEPGIYIREEGFGIRLEDDLVVQESAPPLNLTQDIPIEIEEIEELMDKIK